MLALKGIFGGSQEITLENKKKKNKLKQRIASKDS